MPLPGQFRPKKKKGEMGITSSPMNKGPLRNNRGPLRNNRGPKEMVKPKLPSANPQVKPRPKAKNNVGFQMSDMKALNKNRRLKIGSFKGTRTGLGRTVESNVKPKPKRPALPPPRTPRRPTRPPARQPQAAPRPKPRPIPKPKPTPKPKPPRS